MNVQQALDVLNSIIQEFEAVVQTTTGLIVASTLLLGAIGAFLAALRRLRRKRKKTTQPSRKPPTTPSMSTRTASRSRSKDSAHVAPSSQKLPPRVEEIYLTEEETYLTEEEVVYPLRRHAQRALTAVSRLSSAAADLVEASYKEVPRTKKLKKYAKQIATYAALARAFNTISNECGELDAALEELRLPFGEVDPRVVFLSYLDPFVIPSVQRTPEEMAVIFRREAERVVQALAKVGYDIQTKQDPWDKKRPPTFNLAR